MKNLIIPTERGETIQIRPGARFTPGPIDRTVGIFGGVSVEHMRDAMKRAMHGSVPIIDAYESTSELLDEWQAAVDDMRKARKAAEQYAERFTKINKILARLSASHRARDDHAGVVCPHCGTFNRHDECGTYQVLNPICKECEGPIESRVQRIKKTDANIIAEQDFGMPDGFEVVSEIENPGKPS